MNKIREKIELFSVFSLHCVHENKFKEVFENK